LGACFDQVSELPALRLRALTRSSGRAFVLQTGGALKEKGVAIVAYGLLAQAEPLGDFLHALVVSQDEQGMQASDHPQIAMAIGLLKAARELLACKGAEV
jgi:hypothetical protein